MKIKNNKRMEQFNLQNYHKLPINIPKDFYGEIPQMDGQELKTGVKKDEGKARFELIAWEVVEAVARILTEGAKKYDPRNWEKGILYGRVFSGVLRHLTAWFNAKVSGTDGINHSDGNESHLDHAITGLMFLSAYEKRGMAQFDDRPTK